MDEKKYPLDSEIRIPIYFGNEDIVNVLNCQFNLQLIPGDIQRLGDIGALCINGETCRFSLEACKTLSKTNEYNLKDSSSLDDFLDDF